MGSGLGGGEKIKRIIEKNDGQFALYIVILCVTLPRNKEGVPRGPDVKQTYEQNEYETRMHCVSAA